VGIRQTLNENPVVTTSVTGLIIVVALVVLFRSACSGGGGGGGAGVPSKQFFTIDDGKNYFPDDASKIPPFMHEGKPAYGVKVYKCPDGTTYVSHLERYSDADKKRLEEAAAKAKDKPGSPPMDGFMLLGNMEVKKPGDKQWVSMSSGGPEKYMAVMRPRCPDGSTNVTPVMPD
jgi:hypothetical protein